MWLLFDMHNLCHRAFHTTGGLSFNGVSTGTTFGVLRAIVDIQEKFNTPNLAFFFDLGRSIRYEIYPGYKDRKRTKEQRSERRSLQREIKSIRKDILPSIGFCNIFAAEGYEADDLIAKFARRLPGDDEALIVSTDQDFYQCLTNRVSIYNPRTKRVIDKETFRKEWGLGPSKWIDIKTIAGCKSDTIPGVDGVAEITAAKYLRGESVGAKTLDKIEAFLDSDDYDRNRTLVKLPLNGTPSMTIQEDNVTRLKWRKLCKRLGMNKLKNEAPIIL